MKIFNLILFALITISLSAQSLDEELGFIYVKADYLLETNRYDEAISEFTKIIAKNPSFRDALYKRAEAKFNVGAFKGTKNDLLEVFDVKGITPESILLYGKTQKNLGNTEQAATTMETADILFPNGSTPRKKSQRTSDDDDNSDDSGSAENELDKLKDRVSSILDDLLPDDDKEDDTDDEPSTSDDRTRTSTDTGTTRGTMDRGDNDNTNTSSGTTRRKQVEPEVPAEPEIDDSVREIYIDDEVTLEVKNGLGARKILEQPSILILSDTSGEVVIDLCINENGKVMQAEFNASESTLKTQSIISLAVRKAKEFWFERSGEDEMCGTIVYKITGS